jgi:hypothetical protein
VLSPLQRKVLEIVRSIEGTEGLALAGGGGLIVQGIVDRETEDLDLFGTSPGEVNRGLPVIEKALRDHGLRADRDRIADGFARLIISSEDETTNLDLAWDPRILPPEQTAIGPVLQEEELAAGKMLALFGRALPRDFIDVSRLVDRFGLERLCELAAERDAGFDREVFVEMLSRFRRWPRADFDLVDSEYERLGQQVEDWREQLQGRHVERPDRQIGKERPGLGL